MLYYFVILKRWLIASQMEYIEARKAFVSFDEPGFKSIFRTTIIHDESLTTTLSNNVIKSKENL
jgi:aminopeptidase N